MRPPDRFSREQAVTARVSDERLVFHPVHLDKSDAILPWSEHPAPFHDVTTRAFAKFVAIPPAAHGHPAYFTSSMFDGATFAPAGWVHNPTGLAAMLLRASIRYRAYAGDERPLQRARALADHILAHGLTAEDDAWSRVPYASADAGSLDYRGGDDTRYCADKTPCGRGDGVGFLEPDKVGELGHALLLLHEATSEGAYLAAAKRCADALAKHVRKGDGSASPWPFRVDAKTGAHVREPWGTNVIFAIALFDELERIGVADHAHRTARDLAWTWLLEYPLRDHTWQGYFEDIPIYEKPGTNPNQYSAGETARYLLAHPERDPEWRRHVESILAWIAKTFASREHGAEVLSEQLADMAKMGSHTARFASIVALLYEKTGDSSLRARAFRSFSWATYCMNDEGVVKVGPDDREGYWFSDGYGDYLPHFLDGMAAVPAWAPSNENHLLRASSVLKSIRYGEHTIAYEAFDATGTEELRLAAAPVSIVGGTFTARAMPGGGAFVRVQREGSRAVTLTLP